MTTRFHDWGNDVKAGDPKLFDLVEHEMTRQEEGLELIASENYVSKAILQAAGSVLTNKYAEGYPGKRYYGGCEWVDPIESLAIERAKQLFSAETANVQPHSGSQANMAAYFAFSKPGDTILGMSLSQGGHLTHGSPVNFSGKLYKVEGYGLHAESHRLDYDQIRDHAKRVQPRLLIAGASAYPRVIDFEAFASIAKDVGADLVVDMAHIAGLVAAGVHPSPIPHARVVTTTTHKTLRGPRAGLILCKTEDLKTINSQIFPGIQGGPLMHIIAAKAICFGEALRPDFKTYQKQVVSNCKTLADQLIKRGLDLVTGGTDNHLVLVDLTRFSDGTVTGKDAEIWLDLAGITVNKNTVPNEKRSPFVTSGIRIGTPAITTRGLKDAEARQVANWIVDLLESKGSESLSKKIRGEIKELCKRFPVYQKD